MRENHGQITFQPEQKKKEVKEFQVEIKFNIKRIIFYGLAALFVYFLLSYSYKLIAAYEDFYYLIDSYSHNRENASETNIIVITPTVGEEIIVPFKTVGKARTFDNDLVIQVRNHSTGNVIYQKKTEVTSEKTKQFGNFSTIIAALNPLPQVPGNITLEFYLESEKEEKSNLVTIPLQLHQLQ
jgi:flagellar basal body-associated protein FliL